MCGYGTHRVCDWGFAELCMSLQLRHLSILELMYIVRELGVALRMEGVDGDDALGCESGLCCPCHSCWQM